ncbi:MAG: lysophospholipid acyltransferase family protein [bacterium]|nr:lysophospholipid acyltransferase family protein [bacterium]
MRLPRPLFLLQRKMLHLVTNTVIGLVRILPERGGYALGRNIAIIAWNCIPRWRRTADTNMRIFYKGEPRGADTRNGYRERMKLGRVAAVNLGYHAIEFVRMGFLPVKRALEMIVETEGVEDLQESLTLGRGAIVLGMHYGNWELAGAKMTSIHQMHAVGKEQRDPFFTNLAFPLRARFGMINLSSTSTFKSAIVRALRDGDVLGLAADQNGGKNGTFANFAGTPASTANGPAVLAMRFGAPLHMIYAYRLAPGRLRFVLSPRVEVDDIEGYDPLSGKYTPEALVACLERINAEYEKILRRDPTQWMWGHPRWKTRPPGEPHLYS